MLTKDAADTLIPRIHKVDALLESIGTFRIEAEECGGDGSGGLSDPEPYMAATLPNHRQRSLWDQP